MHYGTIPAVGIKVYTVNSFGVGVFYAVAGDETSDFGVVITGYEIVQPRFCIIVITAVAERI